MDRIRLAKETDAQRVLEIYSPFVLNTAISFETKVPSLSEIKDRITETLTKFPYLIYESDDQVVGYAYAGAHRSRCAYGWSVESSVYVDPRFHGRKIGSKLCRALFDLLKTQQIVNIYACIALPNEASVRLHESLGFKAIGRFEDVGFKLGKWWDVGWWQLQIQKPREPGAVLPPVSQFEISP